MLCVFLLMSCPDSVYKLVISIEKEKREKKNTAIWKYRYSFINRWNTRVQHRFSTLWLSLAGLEGSTLSMMERTLKVIVTGATKTISRTELVEIFGGEDTEEICNLADGTP